MIGNLFDIITLCNCSRNIGWGRKLLSFCTQDIETNVMPEHFSLFPKYIVTRYNVFTWDLWIVYDQEIIKGNCLRIKFFPLSSHSDWIMGMATVLGTPGRKGTFRISCIPESRVASSLDALHWLICSAQAAFTEARVAYLLNLMASNFELSSE